ncbi:Dynein heavy chain 7, axonemal [Araneus ventricosus]|uniref:Dynein heavy chain 7, axonemal n=1 Tax=Araneus ventricosus TaxID=182803 RepID=A0A4Y2WAT7_ARAVE|nr:Dynein heavy chain 7, axonemal [Araneus ventricosus]
MSNKRYFAPPGSEKKLEKSEFKFFLTGGVGLENPLPNPAPTWLPDKSWDEVCRLADFPALQPLREELTSNPDIWKPLYDSKEPQNLALPGKWDESTTPFQKLLILRCLRADKGVDEVVKHLLSFPSLDNRPLVDQQLTFRVVHLYIWEGS